MLLSILLKRNSKVTSPKMKQNNYTELLGYSFLQVYKKWGKRMESIFLVTQETPRNEIVG